MVISYVHKQNAWRNNTSHSALVGEHWVTGFNERSDGGVSVLVTN